jgi:hypothetical protein
VYYVHASGDGRIQGDNVPEARKMAQTNMLSKASSFLGVGLGVYKGMGHDDPYLASQASSPVVTQDAPPKIEPGDVKPISAKRAQQLTAIGVAAFGEGWPDARLPMVLAVTKKRTVTIDDLSGDECERMIAAIKCNQAGSAKYGAEWGAKRTNWLGTQNVTDVVELSQVRIEQAISKLEAP